METYQTGIKQTYLDNTSTDNVNKYDLLQILANFDKEILNTQKSDFSLHDYQTIYYLYVDSRHLVKKRTKKLYKFHVE